MTWTTPRTWSTGELVTDTEMNENVRDNLSHVGGLAVGSDTVSTIATGGTILPPGVVLPYAGASAPTGWVLCDGSAVSRTTYSGLFALIGTTFGAGDASTTFNVPDLRGRIPLGKDNMGGSSANRVTAAAADTVGSGAGAETHTLAPSEMPSHSHSINTRDTTFTDAAGGANVAFAVGSVNTFAVAGSVAAQAGYPFIVAAGSGGAHANVQPYLTLNYIIKT